jgi:hypothetical protein
MIEDEWEEVRSGWEVYVASEAQPTFASVVVRQWD